MSSRLQNPFVGAAFQSSLKPRNVNCLGYLGNKFPRKPRYDIIPRAKKNNWISHGIRFSQSFGENVEILWKNMGLRSGFVVKSVKEPFTRSKAIVRSLSTVWEEASTGLPSRRSRALLGTYEDNRFKSESKKPYLKSIGSLNLGGGPELEKKLKYTEHVCSGVILGKELVNAPPNVLTPGVSAEEAEKIASTIDCDKLSDIGSEYEGFWIDTADKQPCIGMGGMIPWKLHVTGKLFHSGLAHKGDSLLIILKSFIEKQSAQSTRKLSLCMSATVDSQLFSNYFGDCPVIHAQGRTHPIPTYFLEDIHDSLDYKLASDSLASLRSNAPKQKCLAFPQQKLMSLQYHPEASPGPHNSYLVLMICQECSDYFPKIPHGLDPVSSMFKKVCDLEAFEETRLKQK
ncbi:hypothetical protein Lser_V15G33035 [Lactuca serriola]